MNILHMVADAVEKSQDSALIISAYDAKLKAMKQTVKDLLQRNSDLDYENERLKHEAEFLAAFYVRNKAAFTREMHPHPTPHTIMCRVSNCKVCPK